MNGDGVICFDGFGVEHISEGIKKFIGNKNITTNIYKIQASDSVICRYFSIGYINFMLKDQSLLDYTNLFSSNKYEKRDGNFLDTLILAIVVLNSPAKKKKTTKYRF